MERIFVHNGAVLAVVLHGDFGVVLDQDGVGSAEVADAIENKMTTRGVDFARSQNGSDGGWPLTGHVFINIYLVAA